MYPGFDDGLAREHAARIRAEVERDCDALMASYAGMVPDALEGLSGEERLQLYRMLRIEVYVGRDGDLDIRGLSRHPYRRHRTGPLFVL